MTTSAWFDYNVYMANKLVQVREAEPAANWDMMKLVKAFSDAGFVDAAGAEEHFKLYGQYEDVAPNAFFNATEYYRAKAADFYKYKYKDPKAVTDLDVATIQVAIKDSGMSAWSHYEQYGNTEKVNPSNSFDTEAYMSAKLTALNNVKDGKEWTLPEVYAAFKAAGLSALEHFMLYGGDGDGEVAQKYDPAKPAIPTEFAVPEEKKVNNSGSSDGKTFTLTQGIDVIDTHQAIMNNGTLVLPEHAGDGDDTFIATFGNSLQAADQLDGGTGTDTLKVYGTFVQAELPISMKNIEVLEIVKTADAAIDVSGVSGLEKVILTDAAALSGKIVTTASGVSLQMGTTNGVATAGEVTWAASATDTAAHLILDGYQGKAAAPAAMDITGAGMTTLHISSTGGANKIGTLDVGAKVTTVNVDGNQSLTFVYAAGNVANISKLDAGAMTSGGSVEADMSAGTLKAGFTFTGSLGNDTFVLTDDQLGSLTSGAQLNAGEGDADKLGIQDTALSATEYAALNATKDFEILGIHGALALDAKELSTIKHFSLDANAVQSITGLKTGSVVDIAVAHASNITLTGDVGVHDVAVSIGTAANAGFTIGGTLKIGGTAVTLTSNGDGTAANVITTLTNAANSTYTLLGSNDLTITTTGANAVGSKFDGSEMTGKLNITGSADAYNTTSTGDILIGGSAADTLKSSINGATMTGNGGNDTFDVSASKGGTTGANIPIITDFTVGDKVEFANKGTEVFTTTKLDVSGLSLNQALDIACASNVSTDGLVKWFQHGGATYIINDQGTATTFSADDFAVKLVGTLDLSNSTFDATTSTLTFA